MVHPYPSDRLGAQCWARALLDRADWVILDTETTGLDASASVVQVGVLAPSGAVLFDSLVQSRSRIPSDASAIHGITNAMVADAPSFREVHEQLTHLLGDQLVVCYNAEFDRRLLRQSGRPDGLVVPGRAWECAMEQYARYLGNWSPTHRSYRFTRLPDLTGGELRRHQAIGDCRATLAVIQRMASE